MKISVVIPVYDEAETLPELCQRLGDALSGRMFDYEVIFVNDGSRDRSAAIIRDWIKNNHRVVLLEMSRNFGHQAAITAGLGECSGDAVVVMDADLQDPPEMIEDMIAKWREGFKVVVAERMSRQEGPGRRVLFNLFYKVFSLLSDPPVRVTSGVFGLMDKTVVRHLRDLPEQNRFIPGLRSWVGFETATLRYERGQRLNGEPRQSLQRLVKYGSDAIFSFSYKPLHFILYFGLGVSMLSFLYVGYLLALRLMNINVVSGFTTVAVAVFFFSGVILISIGVIGEYLSRIYDEVKRRPLFILSNKVFRREDSPDIAVTECSDTSCSA